MCGVIERLSLCNGLYSINQLNTNTIESLREEKRAIMSGREEDKVWLTHQMSAQYVA